MTPEETIGKTLQELKNHENEWRQKYENYLVDACKNRDSMISRRKKFHKFGNLSVYTSIGKVKDDSNCFDLRYQGQSVGSIKVSRKGEVILVIDDDQYKANSNEKYLKGYPKDLCAAGEYDWKKKVAAAFRAYFNSDPGKSGHPEHRYENALLLEFHKKDGRGKSFPGIQPVTIGKNSDLFFQMPTPLSASGKDVKYSNGHGGIDILARVRRAHDRLAVFELKDEYSKGENPDKVISQAIGYATFIIELCKSEVARNKFWELCGYGKNPSGREIIDVSILMPDPGDGSEPAFKLKTLSVPGSEMKIQLHYTFFDKESIKITRSSL